jgi:hypothetical protein
MTVIKTNEATIKTCAIEIKALTVSKRQVTMGLFRQLQQEELIDLETMEFRGLPWGRVNYFWNGCHSSYDPETTGPFLHVVWQKDTELRRDVVPRRVHSYASEVNNDLGVLDAIYHVALCRSQAFTIKSDRSVGQYIAVGEKSFALDNMSGQYTKSEVIKALRWAPQNTECRSHGEFEMQYPGLKQPSLDDAINLLVKLLKRPGTLHFGLEDAGAADEADRLREEREWFRDSWEQRYRELADLDQLFIAV